MKTGAEVLKPDYLSYGSLKIRESTEWKSVASADSYWNTNLVLEYKDEINN